MEQKTGSKLGVEYNKAVYCLPVYLIYMQSKSWELPGWISYKLESELPGEIPTTSYADNTNGRKWRGTKEPLDEGERGGWKSWPKTQH